MVQAPPAAKSKSDELSHTDESIIAQNTVYIQQYIYERRAL